MRPTGSRVGRWAPYALVILCLFLFGVWYTPSIRNQYPGHTSYVEDGVQLSSFASPFHCDIESLPQQTRLVRRTREDYVVMVHGFDDVISNFHWKGLGWEEDIADLMASYMAV